MSIQEDFSNYLSDWGAARTGALRLGSSSLYSSQIFPSIIRRFSSEFPGVQVSMIEGNSVKLQAMLQEGDLDIIIDNFTLDPMVYDNLVYKEERIFLAVPAKFEINTRLRKYQLPASALTEGPEIWNTYAPVPLIEFQNEPFIFLKPENDTGRRAVMFCHNAGFVPNVLFELDQQMTSYQITRNGLAVSFLSDTLITNLSASDQIIYYPLDPNTSHRRLCLYWKRSRFIGRAMEEFLRIAKTMRGKTEI